jgi:hypothetical protein
MQRSGVRSPESGKYTHHCTEEIDTNSSQAQHLAERHQLEISTLRLDATNSAAKAEKELRARNKKIQYLEKKVFSLGPGTMFYDTNRFKVEALRNERAAKAREFSEAQEHISRLMSVMGFTKEKDESSNKQPAAGPSKAKEPVRRSTRLSLLQAQSPSQTEMTTTQTQSSYPAIPLPSTESFFNQDATITTRRRSHRFSQATSFVNDENTTYFSSTQERAIEGLSGVRRQPLGNLDRNSPKKSPPSTNPKDAEHDKLGQQTQIESQANINITDLDLDLDFEDEDVLTSTVAR